MTFGRTSVLPYPLGKENFMDPIAQFCTLAAVILVVGGLLVIVCFR